MKLLEGKNAVVTGGSRGIGRAICLDFARNGANVVVNYAGNEAAAAETVEACEAYGVKAVAVQADVATAEGAAQLFKLAQATLGKVDILVNNAGITRDALLMTAKEEEYDAVMDVNLKSAFLCSKIAARFMLKQKSGRIINMSSVVGLHGNVGQAVYAASKAGMIGLTKSAAKELASRGITVNAVAPGFIDTDMTEKLPENVKTAILASIPMARLGTPAETAETVSFLASERAAYITGQVISIDGGMST